MAIQLEFLARAQAEVEALYRAPSRTLDSIFR